MEKRVYKINRKMNFFTAAGVIFLAAACLLAGYNIWRDHRAGQYAGKVVSSMAEDLNEKADKNAVFMSGAEDFEKQELPDYVLAPDMEMPTETIDGNNYIGMLEIPALSLELPILAQWSYPGLRLAPCRYTGSAYQNNMVIAAHNYSRHFGRLNRLAQGDPILFTDVDGNRFCYEVTELETLSPYDIDAMINGNCDMTLFTCTVGGSSRVAIRCELLADRNRRTPSLVV